MINDSFFRLNVREPGVVIDADIRFDRRQILVLLHRGEGFSYGRLTLLAIAIPFQCLQQEEALNSSALGR